MYVQILFIQLFEIKYTHTDDFHTLNLNIWQPIKGFGLRLIFVFYFFSLLKKYTHDISTIVVLHFNMHGSPIYIYIYHHVTFN